MSKNENKDDLLSKEPVHYSSDNKQSILSEKFEGKESTLVDPSGTSHKAILLFIENKAPEANSSDKKKNDEKGKQERDKQEMDRQEMDRQDRDKQEHDRQENHEIKSEEAERKFRYEERKQNNEDINKIERKSSDVLKKSIKGTNKVSIKRGQKYEEEEVETLPYRPYRTQLPPTFTAPSLTFPPTGIPPTDVPPPAGIPPIDVPSTGVIPTNILLPDQLIQQLSTVQPNISQNKTSDQSAIIALQQQIPGVTPNEAMNTIQQCQQQGILPEAAIAMIQQTQAQQVQQTQAQQVQQTQTNQAKNLYQIPQTNVPSIVDTQQQILTRGKVIELQEFGPEKMDVDN
ncbi:hypothetical protein Glove_208g196 [Diversispora epigaea]|uniref:Uncharacterized protein n=1 Tax=Diversispora epigaea TaxID=1348612 RepID=A0A397INW8_9GLOM|nr:hypothetical protein Glove_208g196 [Diversispora epigaea]